MSTMMTVGAATHWSDEIHGLFKTHGIEVIPFVPDGGLKDLIEHCQADPMMRTVTLTTEEEGVACAVGAFLGGKRAAVLMQSSGVGNCINMLSLPQMCQAPLLMLVTMRGEWGEFNPWQIPMGQSTPRILEASGVLVYRIESSEDVGPTIEAAIKIAYESRRRVAVLLSQRFLGAKDFGGKGK